MKHNTHTCVAHVPTPQARRASTSRLGPDRCLPAFPSLPAAARAAVGVLCGRPPTRRMMLLQMRQHRQFDSTAQSVLQKPLSRTIRKAVSARESKKLGQHAFGTMPPNDRARQRPQLTNQEGGGSLAGLTRASDKACPLPAPPLAETRVEGRAGRVLLACAAAGCGWTTEEARRNAAAAND